MNEKDASNRLKSKPRHFKDDIEVLVYAPDDGAYSLVATREALADYANPRGYDGDLDSLLMFALADLLLVADNIYQRERRPDRVTVTTKDLNG